MPSDNAMSADDRYCIDTYPPRKRATSATVGSEKALSSSKNFSPLSLKTAYPPTRPLVSKPSAVCYPQAMPAPKQPQTIKDQTYRRREVRKHRRACRKTLGPLGMYLFREFLNLHGRLPIESTAIWAEAMAQAFGDHGTTLRGRVPEAALPGNLSDYRGKFGGWSQALLRRQLKLPSGPGLCFTLRIVEVRGSRPTTWRGLILVLYERRTGVLFHQLIRSDGRHPPGDDTVWRAVNQAVLRLSTGRWPRIKEEVLKATPVTVALPVDASGSSTHPIFAEAARHAKDGIELAMPNHADVRAWSVSTFRGLNNISHTAGPYTFLELEKMLRDEARNVSTSLRMFRQRVKTAASGKSRDTERPRRPAWLLLFPRDYQYQFRRGD